MADNKDLHIAKSAKKDEFYTQLCDIEYELIYYKEHFKNKVVYCNCDDPFESNFFKYFAMNFNALGLKKLICTCYNGNNNILSDYDLFSQDIKIINEKAYKIEIDYIDDSMLDLSNIKTFFESKNCVSELNGDGDFRSSECIELLKESDIVVTNPPFSLFREYVAQLFEYDKKFLIIGNVNAISYKEIFPYIKDNKLWLGASIHSGDREFLVPDDYPLNAAGFRIDENGKKYIRVKGVRWFTNLDYKKRHEKLQLTEEYNPNKYPKYDNYNAIDVGFVKDIPKDYYEPMGVPITFLDKYNTEQFELIGDSYFLAEPVTINNKLKRNPQRFYVNGKRKYDRIVINRKIKPENIDTFKKRNKSEQIILNFGITE